MMMTEAETLAEQVAVLRRQCLAGHDHVKYLQKHPFPTPNQKEVLTEYLRQYPR
jgi:hypothetical protein